MNGRSKGCSAALLIFLMRSPRLGFAFMRTRSWSEHDPGPVDKCRWPWPINSGPCCIHCSPVRYTLKLCQRGLLLFLQRTLYRSADGYRCEIKNHESCRTSKSYTALDLRQLENMLADVQGVTHGPLRAGASYCIFIAVFLFYFFILCVPPQHCSKVTALHTATPVKASTLECRQASLSSLSHSIGHVFKYIQGKFESTQPLNVFLPCKWLATLAELSLRFQWSQFTFDLQRKTAFACQLRAVPLASVKMEGVTVTWQVLLPFQRFFVLLPASGCTSVCWIVHLFVVEQAS